MDVSQIIKQLEEERVRIDAAISALKNIGEPGQGKPAKAAATPKKRKLSAAGRARIAAAARVRWANAKVGKK